MEGWSLLYEARAELACFRSRSGTQESSSAEYPFHRIRKEREDGVPRWCMIFSILYSSSPSIRSGGGTGKFLLWMSFSRYGDKREAWKTGWIFQVFGSRSW